MVNSFDAFKAESIINKFDIDSLNNLSSLDKHYQSNYPVLIEAVADICKNLNDQSFSLIAHLVYAWMPTILKSIDSNEKHKNICQKVLCLDSNEIHKIKDFIQDDLTKDLVNNSWVGLSKVLHFINPAVFPIWDSNVANCFSVNTSSKNNYIKYVAFMNELNLKENPQVLSVMEITQTTFTRACEFVLFIEGRKLKSHS